MIPKSTLLSRGHTRFPTFEDIPERYPDEFVEAAAFYEKGIEIYSPAPWVVSHPTGPEDEQNDTSGR
ncbi:MAG TPA: hypothetical protein EYP53_05370 [Candidatus Latescibacteria bacterium]|nr:hypothetical protein [Candidatus Latescibacterota bacterium]